jgi:L-glutamine-phosphate cytidylyltransferase
MEKEKLDVVILAAGVGSRLYPMTKDIPKCMIQVAGQSLIERVLSQFHKHNLGESTYILTGYLHDKLYHFVNQNFNSSTCIFNEDYQVTNNMYSLYLFLKQRDKNRDLIVLNADCIYDDSIIDRCISFEGSCIMTDSSIYLEESMKVKIESNRIVAISKTITSDSNVFTSIDLYKFNSDTANILSEIVFKYIDERELNKWTEVAIHDLVSSRGHQIFHNDIAGLRWYEIDNLNDLEHSNKLFSGEM